MRQIDDVIKELLDNITRNQTYVEKLLTIKKKFPDLKEHVDRWKKVRYCSELANLIVNDCEISYNCGCCSDSPLQVWPYLEIEEIKIYSNPLGIYIGERNYWQGDNPNEGWESDLQACGLSENIIKKVQVYFDNHQPYSSEDKDDVDTDW